MVRAGEAIRQAAERGIRGAWLGLPAAAPGPGGVHPLHAVAEPCTLRSAGGRVRDGLVRQAGAAKVVIAGVGGLQLGQEVDLVLPRRGGLRLRARIAGIGVLGLLLDLRTADCGAAWRMALLGITDGACRAA